eukprot:CFRG3454T1
MKSYLLLPVLAACQSLSLVRGERLASIDGEVELNDEKPIVLRVNELNEESATDTELEDKDKVVADKHMDFIEDDGWDRRGYHMWANQKGKFNQQVSHAMAMIGTTAKLGRNVVLPAFSVHDESVHQTRLMKFDEVFDVEYLKTFDPRFITLEQFVEKFGNTRWPPENRFAYCDEDWPLYNKATNCNIKSSPSLRQYWDAYGIDFIGQKPFSRTKRPVPDDDPVFVTTLLARYPLEPRLESLYSYFRWNHFLLDASIDYVEKYLPRPFMATQVFNSPAWRTVCQSATKSSKPFLASRQCLNKNEQVYGSLCSPGESKMILEIVDLVIKQEVKSIFLTADAITDSFIPNLKMMLSNKGMKDVIIIAGTGNEVLDMVVQELSDVFLGNCVAPASEVIANFRKHHIPEEVRPPVFYFGRPLE